MTKTGTIAMYKLLISPKLFDPSFLQLLDKADQTNNGGFAIDWLYSPIDLSVGYLINITTQKNSSILRDYFKNPSMVLRESHKLSIVYERVHAEKLICESLSEILTNSKFDKDLFIFFRSIAPLTFNSF